MLSYLKLAYCQARRYMKPFTRSNLQELMHEQNGPRVSAFMPTHRGAAETLQDQIRFKNLLRQAEENLEPRSKNPTPVSAAEQIYHYAGHKFEPESARELRRRIMQHQWFLSERLKRDVRFKIACLDFIENVGPMCKELGARITDRSIWDTISENQPPKQIVNRTLIERKVMLLS